jgi:omega-amidase
LILRIAQIPVQASWNASMQTALKAAEARPRPDVLILPELFTIGYVLHEIPGCAISQDELHELPLAVAAGELGIWIIGGTFPVRKGDAVVNMLPVYDDTGSLVHTTEKVHLFRNMGEDTVFAPGTPAGVMDLKGTVTGISICYDLRFPELFRRHVLKGAELLVVPAQWPEPRLSLFRSFLRARSGEAQVFTAGCNIGGEHLGVRFGGGGGVSHPSGKMVPGSPVSEYVKDHEIDMGDVKRVRERIDCLSDRRPEVYGGSE